MKHRGKNAPPPHRFHFSEDLCIVGMNDINWEKYQERVWELECEGFTTSDAQGIVDAEMIKDPTLFRIF